MAIGQAYSYMPKNILIESYLQISIYLITSDFFFHVVLFSLQRVYAKGDVYPDSSKLPKGEYCLQLYLRY